MSTLKHPSILIDLGHVGENGLPLNQAPWFQRELELCREWGFQLQIANSSVSLLFDHEQLVPYWVQKETPAIAWDWLRVNGFLRTNSTNAEAIELARTGAPNGTLVYAEEQTAGKGRKDRIWFSPQGLGLYFTLLLRPTQPLHVWPLLTHAAAVALVRTLKDLSDHRLIPNSLSIDLKWPNDVLLSGKKCAGILLESFGLDNGNRAAIVGLGINVHRGSVPANIRSAAACLDEMAGCFVPRRQLLVSFLHSFQLCYVSFEQGKHTELLQEWKSYSSMWNGVQVSISDGEERRNGITCGINDFGALLVRTPEGSVETVLAGDISVRRIRD
jgi:BirA family transcriptional regulator, biotin operon repressor / biotin---[acetyl-CoA-carboxylase] ligase